jgi:hypothetical protein
VVTFDAGQSDLDLGFVARRVRRARCHRRPCGPGSGAPAAWRRYDQLAERDRRRVRRGDRLRAHRDREAGSPDLRSRARRAGRDPAGDPHWRLVAGRHRRRARRGLAGDLVWPARHPGGRSRVVVARDAAEVRAVLVSWLSAWRSIAPGSCTKVRRPPAGLRAHPRCRPRRGANRGDPRVLQRAVSPWPREIVRASRPARIWWSIPIGRP